MRFSNDVHGFEGVFQACCEERGKGWRQWWGRKWRGLEERWGKVMDRCGGGRARRALRRAEGFARGGWVHVAPCDVWRFDTGGGKRIAGVAGGVGQEARVVILSPEANGATNVAFRRMGHGVGVLRAEAKNWKMLEGMMTGARGWIFENPLQYASWRESGGRERTPRRVVYDATNVFVEAYGRLGIGKETLMSAERRLLEDAERVWFCTEADRETTRRRYADLDGGGWEILPNGIDRTEMGEAVVPSETRKMRGALGWKRPVALFAGSNYGPNYEVVDEISRTWAPKHPGVAFVVLGMRMDRYLKDGGVPPAENVVFTGLVSEEEKRVLYDLADVAIAPVKTGTGSSLKVPEAIARGKVVVGTRVGLRGFEEWTKWDSVCMSERGEETLEEVWARLAREPRAYDDACRGAAEEMQRRYTWGALMEKWRGQWGGKGGMEGQPRTGGKRR